MKLAFPNLLSEAEVTAVTVDFGTSSAIKVFLAMRDANWLHYHGNPSTSRGKRIKAALRQAFYPEDDDWKQMVWSGAKQVVYKAIENGSYPLNENGERFYRHGGKCEKERQTAELNR
jgi:hypothetical protein